MGSDKYPDPEIQAAVDFTREYHEEVILVGNKEIIEPKLAALNPGDLPIRIHHAPDMVDMGDKAVEGSRTKPLNSMAVGMDLVKAGEGQAFVTAGNTGAAMFNGLRKLGRMKGVQRPALAALFPVKGGRCVICDIGANVDCRPEFLLQFAVMGSIYAEKMLDKEKPRVGLISNGEEPGKGNDLVKHTYPLLAESGLNFIGNVEGKELFGGMADVAVTDGFTGNIILKSSEAVAKMLVDALREGLTSSIITKLGAVLAQSAFVNLKKMMDPSEVGAAPLLGIDGLVFVGHGRSNARAMYNALVLAHKAVEMDLLGAMRQAIQSRLAQMEAINSEK